LPVYISNSNSSDVVELDIGGTIFRVSKTTLGRVPNKIIDYLKSNNLQRIFIDADPDAFKPVS
jgi:hypothetical protein